MTTDPRLTEVTAFLDSALHGKNVDHEPLAVEILRVADDVDPLRIGLRILMDAVPGSADFHEQLAVVYEALKARDAGTG